MTSSRPPTSRPGVRRTRWINCSNKLQDVHSFAKPLLQAKLKERYGIEDDVSTTYLRLYLPKDLPWYAH